MKRHKKHPEEQYLELLEDILKNGVQQEDKGSGAITRSVFGRQIRFNLSEGFPLLTTKKVYWKGVVYELAWFLSGQSNVQYLSKNGVHIWDDYPYRIYREKMEQGRVPELAKEEFVARLIGDDAFAQEHGELRHIYSEMWRRWPAKDGRLIDQVSWIVNELRDDPDAHNTLVSSWNPEYLYAMAKPEEACRFPICHNMYQVNIKNGRLSLQLYQRTADMFLGVPFNIASYALLTHILALVTGTEPGDFIHTFGDAHIYDNHIDQVKEQLSRNPRPFPNVKISGEVRDIDTFRPEHVELSGYDPHPAIKGELSPVGGFKTKDWETYLKKKESQ